MTVREGDRLPDADFLIMGEHGPALISTTDVFEGRSVALFGLPGAYTPVCHAEHLPGIVGRHSELRRHGIDVVACTAVNDVYVMHRWALELGAVGKILMLADGNGDFANCCGLAVDLRTLGLGWRSNRYAMIVTNRIIRVMSIEDALMQHAKSSALAIKEKLEEANA